MSVEYFYDVCFGFYFLVEMVKGSGWDQTKSDSDILLKFVKLILIHPKNYLLKFDLFWASVKAWIWRATTNFYGAVQSLRIFVFTGANYLLFCYYTQPLNLINQSPEVTSKAAPGEEQEFNDSFKTLSEKLSEALQNIRAKEELVNQHAKVAEEAVSGIPFSHLHYF